MKISSIIVKVVLTLVAFGANPTVSHRDESEQSRRRHLTQKSPCEVLVRVVNLGAGKKEEKHMDCKMSAADGGNFVEIKDHTSKGWLKSHKGELESGRTELFLPGAIVNKNELILSEDSNEVIERTIEITKQGKNRREGKKSKKKDRTSRSRNLAETIDNDKRILAVRVIASDSQTSASINQLSDSIFGTYGDPANIKSQYEACSKGQLIVQPATGFGVTDGIIEVTIQSTVNGAEGSAIANDVLAALKDRLGGCEPPCNYDHVMLCLPPGTGNWIAYAYMNSWLSVYNNDWCLKLSAQMHEVGHNLDLHHSGEGSDPYADMSGIMGFSYGVDDGPLMCFNAAKSWQLGWYSGGHVERDFVFSYWKGDLISISDYDKDSPLPVLIRVASLTGDDHYISFNLQSGINIGTQEGANQVLITTTASSGSSAAPSNLVAKLSKGEVYSLSTSVELKVTDINMNAEIPYASIVVGDDCESDVECENSYSCIQSRCVNGLCVNSILDGYAMADITVVTDRYPEETTWSLTNECTGATTLSGGPYSDAGETYTARDCVSSDIKHKFTINDTYGDGICCNQGSGSYNIEIGSETFSGGTFASSTSHSFGSCSTPAPTTLAPITPAPVPITPAPVPTTPAPVPTVPACLGVELELKTDQYGGETSWQLKDNSQLVKSGSGYPSNQVISISFGCLAVANGSDYERYEFIISDSYGDGMCCSYGQGYYRIQTMGGGSIIKDGGSFANTESFLFPTIQSSPSLPPARSDSILPFRLELRTDNWGGETSWKLTSSNNMVYTGNGYSDSTLYNVRHDLPAHGCHTFTMYDAYGDGLLYGWYKLYWNGDLVADHSGNFGNEITSRFGGGCLAVAETDIEDQSVVIRDRPKKYTTPTPTTNAPTWTTITFDDFETGWGNFKDGGSDASRVSIEKRGDRLHIPSGIYAARIRDDSSSSQISHVRSYDVSIFSTLKVSFLFIMKSMDNSNENFLLQVSKDNASYETVASWGMGEYWNNQVYNESIEFGRGAVNTMKIRFLCDASSNEDWVYLDNILFQGKI